MMRVARCALQQQVLQLRAPVQTQKLLLSTRRSSSAPKAKQQLKFVKQGRAREHIKHNAAVLANFVAMREQAAQHTENWTRLLQQ
jgi:hypothetical protein